MEGSTGESNAKRCSSEGLLDLNPPVTLGMIKSLDTPA